MSNDNYSVLKDFAVRREITQAASAASIERKKEAIIAGFSLECPMTLSQTYKKHKLSAKTLNRALVKWGYDIDQLRDQIRENREPYVGKKNPATAKLKSSIDKRKKWNLELIQEQANNYEHRFAFQKGSNPAYQAAWALGVLDIVCAHMVLNRPRVTYEDILAAVRACTSKQEFRERFKTEYWAAINRKILAEVIVGLSDGRR